MNKEITTVHYISPSFFPSKAANAVHVIHQTYAISQLKTKVILYGARDIRLSSKHLKKRLSKEYGVKLDDLSLRLVPIVFKKAINFQIAFYSVLKLVFISFSKSNKIFSRNLYAAFFFNTLLGRKIIFETHQIESGVNGLIQKAILNSKRAKTILITKKLHHILESHYEISIKNSIILSDAAPEGITPFNTKDKKNVLQDFELDLQGYKYVCGYFGHLYEGRGIEVIISLAERLKSVVFLVFGGNDDDIQKIQCKKLPPNIKIMGHVDNSVARKVMLAVDCLLMPYQDKVFIGQKGHDTARWMSPMKMFEYMATCNPIISSDLPALKEVLKNKVNALLVECDDIDAWENALLEVMENKALAKEISLNAYEDYIEVYNWKNRAKQILNFLS